MANTDDLFFSLKDREGNIHEYVVAPHAGMDGLSVIDAMLAIGMGPLIEAAFAAIRASEEQRAAGKAVGKTDVQIQESFSLAEVIEKVDVENLVVSAQQGIRSAGGMSTLAPLVMRHTTRDGVNLFSGKTGRLNSAQFDIAYTQNCGELRAAFLKVMEINNFFELLAGLLADE